MTTEKPPIDETVARSMQEGIRREKARSGGRNAGLIILTILLIGIAMQLSPTDRSRYIDLFILVWAVGVGLIIYRYHKR